ncbi:MULTISPECIES: M16 family metallopeptidase [Dysgonomonas]|uniref:M16 family metallopeptidase n=1 Tax=Dysgonomonas TaxID=156973 RepID=UPI00092C2FF2|nr:MULTISPECIES: pitrilysin family protein [Dysgonomonas]MBN9302890.1 insulinase family protein [Dysgonomonas mossii]OJX58349.1 MAG: peptidase M16 [Dysgonomonas sp. 37-18]
MINYLTHTLSNGLRIVHKPIESNVSYCGFIVNAGTRDEAPDQYGMAHFVEHMLFKGTDKRRAYHIINRMENVGGELNAFTNKEETVVYSVFLEQHFSRAIELLSDITFHSNFPQSEIEKEVEVIIDEIHSYEDSPSELIFDEFENLVFDQSQIGHNILGSAELLQNFDGQMAKAFVNKFYNPSNMVFFSLGRTDFKKIVYYAEKYLSAIPDIKSDIQRIKPVDISSVNKREDKETSQAHVLIGGRSYSLCDPNRRVLNLLNNLLGGPGMNSRLNISLREKRGYVYNVDSSITSYTDTGITSIYFGCDKKNVDKCISLVHKELNRLRKEKLTSSQLSTAKKQLIGQIGVMGDNHENLALALGKNFLHHNHFNTLAETAQKIEAVTAEQILAVSNEIFDERGLFTLIYD